MRLKNYELKKMHQCLFIFIGIVGTSLQKFQFKTNEMLKTYQIPLCKSFLFPSQSYS